MNKRRIICGGGYSGQKAESRWNWILIGEWAVLIVLCLLYARNSGHYADYYPINGTFQNYNPVRRMLNGQIPYKDFQDYLGLGHLYTGTIVTFLFGGSYRDSLIAFSFLTLGSLALLSYVVGFLVLGKRQSAVITTNIVLLCVIIQPLFFKNGLAGTEDIFGALTSALDAGNSARFIRGMILPLICLFILGAHSCFQKIALKSAWLLKHKAVIVYAGMGFIGGIAFGWSNDYGISCCICLAILSFCLSLARDRSLAVVIRNVTVELAASAAGIFICVEVLTLGHFAEWAVATFGTGGFQSWYYNSPKSYYVYDVDFSYIMLTQAGLCIAYIIKLFMKKASADAVLRYGLPAFCNMVCFCAANEYKLLSGGWLREVALSVLFFTVMYEILSLLLKADRNEKLEKLAVFCSFILCGSWIIAGIKDEAVFTYMTPKEGVYVEKLGGNLKTLGEDLVQTEAFLNGENFFSTYASAQEVVCDKYQPSGIDYIIHVLGDAQRERYLEAFHTADFRYTATIKETYNNWEYWVQRANWFFYRDLYENWHPVYANSYELYWDKNDKSNENIIQNGYTVDVVEVSDSEKKIEVRADSDVNGVADVYIDYLVEKRDNRSAKLVFQKMLKIEDKGTEYNYLRSQSQEYIPVPIVNGYGEVTLTACPEKSAYLVLREAACNKIYTCTSDYLEITGVGVEDAGTVLSVKNTQNNQNALADVKEIEVQEKKYPVSSIASDSDLIYLRIDSNVVYEENSGNIMRIIHNREL